MNKLFVSASILSSALFCQYAYAQGWTPQPVQKMIIKQAVAEAKVYTDKAVAGGSADLSFTNKINTLEKEVASVKTIATTGKNTADSAKLAADEAEASIAVVKTELQNNIDTVSTTVTAAAAKADAANTAAGEAKTAAEANAKDIATVVASVDTVNKKAEQSLVGMPCYSFTVYVTDTEIPAGTYVAALKGTTKVAITAGMDVAYRIRAATDKDNIDVYIDWGDGSDVSYAKDGTFTYVDFSDNRYALKHTYAATGLYRVKVYGKRYSKIQPATDVVNYVRTASVGDMNDEIPSFIDNIADMLANSPCVINAQFSGWKLYNTKNLSNLYMNAKNLQSFTTFDCQQDEARAIGNMFNGCVNMTNCDFRISANLSRENSIVSVFANCSSLSVDIATLLPKYRFNARVISVNNLFLNCKSLTGTVPADVLWKDTGVKWLNTSTCFKGCSDEIRAQVPQSWGGTAAD